MFWQVVPAASVFGSSWVDWQRIFAHTKWVPYHFFLFCHHVQSCQIVYLRISSSNKHMSSISFMIKKTQFHFRNWDTIFVYTKRWSNRSWFTCRPIEPIDYLICLPAHGAIIGAWFGAWPMPLDWERTWQVYYFSPPLFLIIRLVSMLILFLSTSFSFFLFWWITSSFSYLLLVIHFHDYAGMAYMCDLWSHCWIPGRNCWIPGCNGGIIQPYITACQRRLTGRMPYLYYFNWKVHIYPFFILFFSCYKFFEHVLELERYSLSLVFHSMDIPFTPQFFSVWSIHISLQKRQYAYNYSVYSEISIVT